MKINWKLKKRSHHYLERMEWTKNGNGQEWNRWKGNEDKDGRKIDI